LSLALVDKVANGNLANLDRSLFRKPHRKQLSESANSDPSEEAQ